METSLAISSTISSHFSSMNRSTSVMKSVLDITPILSLFGHVFVILLVFLPGSFPRKPRFRIGTKQPQPQAPSARRPQTTRGPMLATERVRVMLGNGAHPRQLATVTQDPSPTDPPEDLCVTIEARYLRTIPLSSVSSTSAKAGYRSINTISAFCAPEMHAMTK